MKAFFSELETYLLHLQVKHFEFFVGLLVAPIFITTELVLNCYRKN
jgi:hypothetical protein